MDYLDRNHPASPFYKGRELPVEPEYCHWCGEEAIEFEKVKHKGVLKNKCLKCIEYEKAQLPD
jgi:hypothetical protein